MNPAIVIVGIGLVAVSAVAVIATMTPAVPTTPGGDGNGSGPLSSANRGNDTPATSPGILATLLGYIGDSADRASGIIHDTLSTARSGFSAVTWLAPAVAIATVAIAAVVIAFLFR